ncbi:hypothetical protein [uncultured Aquimarina sp.]|uniref:hypothetical protein n=1 Tax=uncultured Aquimarina sp. TaxID=575652 RepID=UPI0026239817|nr:hypothetical protein [uncultured Aquimarina sp.]
MMNKIFNILFIVLVFVACKTSTKIDPPEIQEVEDPIEIQDDFKPLGTDQIIGQVKGEDNKNLQGVAIKFTLNKDFCVNAYSDFDGKFILQFDKTLINDNSKVELLYEGFSKVIKPFNEFSKNNTVILDKKGDLINKEEYKIFYESIRSCTR